MISNSAYTKYCVVPNSINFLLVEVWIRIRFEEFHAKAKATSLRRTCEIKKKPKFYIMTTTALTLIRRQWCDEEQFNTIR